MSDNSARALWWVKRDMRIKDNDALHYAIKDTKQVSAFFVVEPALLIADETSIMHVHGWWQALHELQQLLRAIGGELYFPQGEVGVSRCVHSNPDFTGIVTLYSG